MKKVYKSEYDSFVKSIREYEEELARISKYKGEVAIYQGDNWHDNPEFYATELKEAALIKKIRELKETLMEYEIIKERDSTMIPENEILEPNLLKNVDMDEELKKEIELKQNFAIKYPIDKDIIVEGIPEAGIDMVLLYRIAYLICSSHNTINSKELLLINPINFDTKLIINELTRLITDEIRIVSIIDFLNDYTNEKFSICKDVSKTKLIEKASNKNSIDKFISEYYNDKLVEDLKIDDQIVFSKERIKSRLFLGNNDTPDYISAMNLFLDIFKENYETILSKLSNKYSEVYKKLPLESEERKELIKQRKNLENTLKKNWKKIIKDYFKELNKKTSDIFALYISNIEEYVNVNDMDDKELLNEKKEILTSLKKLRITEDEIPLLLYIHYQLNKKTMMVKHVIFNDIQTNNELLINTIKRISLNCGITVFKKDNNQLLFDNFEKVLLDKNYESQNNIVFQKTK